MRAVLLTGHGGLDQLEYREDVARPQPGPGEVLVRLRAATVNNTDLATRTAWYARTDDEPSDAPKIETFNKRSIQFPRIQGAGGAGIVEAVGSGVPVARIGEVVMVDPYLRDLSLPPPAQLALFMGSGCDGCFADYVAVPAENAVSVESDLSFAELACLPVGHQTAEEMQQRAGIKPGNKVVISGASGGVGAANVQLARMRGAEVLALAGRAKHDAVRALGATHVIDRDEDVVAASERLWGERAVDVVLDVVGGAQFPALLHSLRRGGHIVSAGAIAGPLAEVDLRAVIYRDLRISGVGTAQPEAMAALSRYAGEGRMKPSIGAMFPLKDLAAAQGAFIEKAHVGKIVVDIENAGASARRSGRS